MSVSLRVSPHLSMTYQSPLFGFVAAFPVEMVTPVVVGEPSVEEVTPLPGLLAAASTLQISWNQA